MPPPFHPSRLIGNLAALVGTVLLAGFLFDMATAWLGYETMAFCALLRPTIAVAYGLAVLLTSLGIIIYVASMFKSDAGIGLALGGVMLFVLPLVLPRYLGAECIPP